MGFEKRLEELGLELPAAPEARGTYVPVVVHDGLCFVAGQLPFHDGVVAYPGRLGLDLSVEEGQQAAALAALNALAAVRATLGTLDCVARVVRVTGYIKSTDDFAEQHVVVNGASDLLRNLFGEHGAHARTSIGLNALPLGAAVEIEIVLAIKEG